MSKPKPPPKPTPNERPTIKVNTAHGVVVLPVINESPSFALQLTDVATPSSQAACTVCGWLVNHGATCVVCGLVAP